MASRFAYKITGKSHPSPHLQSKWAIEHTIINDNSFTMGAHTLDDVVIPGSLHLVDLDGNLNAKHDAGGNKEIVLFPQPTAEYDDPLNWTKRRKTIVATLLLLSVFSGNMMAAELSPALLLIEEEQNIPLATLNQGISVMFLMFGWSNLLWSPLATTYGRRPIFLIGAIGMLGCAIWTAYVKTAAEWYANRFLMGSFYGVLETLIEVGLADMYFAHERGFYIGLYTWTLMGTPFLGSVPAGYIAVNLGWRWIQYIASMIGAACLIGMFFFLEETMFYRPPTQEERIDVAEAGDATPEDGSKISKNASGTQENYEVSMGAGDSRKTFAQRLKFWGARRPGQPHEMFRSVWLPFALLRYPIIVYAGCLTGSVLAWYNVVTATIAYVLNEAPYNFSANGVGLVLLAPFIGCSLGCLIAGYAANRLALIMARRNKGRFEPEHRLWMAVVVFLLHPAGCILFGVGAKQGIHWVGLSFGLGLVVGCFPISSTLAINYIIDSYKEISAEGLVTMILIRNTIGFAFTYGVTPWIQTSGVQNTYIACAFIGMFFAGLTFIFIRWGKTFRKRSARSYWHMVEKYGFRAH